MKMAVLTVIGWVRVCAINQKVYLPTEIIDIVNQMSISML